MRIPLLEKTHTSAAMALFKVINTRKLFLVAIETTVGSMMLEHLDRTLCTFLTTSRRIDNMRWKCDAERLHRCIIA